MLGGEALSNVQTGKYRFMDEGFLVMPRLSHRLPKYRLHRASGLAIVTLNGGDHYLGQYNSPASHQEYDRLISEWLATGRQGGDTADLMRSITVNQLFLAFWHHVTEYYRKEGQPTGEVHGIRYALKPVINLYGDSPVGDFGPLQLKAVRETMIAQGLVRRLINQRIHKIRRMFRWGVESALVSPVVLQGLLALSPLKAGRSAALESPPVRPLAEDLLRKTQHHMPVEIKAMTELQWITGMRPGEVARMRTMDIEQSEKAWVYRPESHKTQHHGISRIIPLGPKAQAVVRPFLNSDRPEAFLFSPCVRVHRWNQQRRENRQTPMTPSQENRRPKRHPRKEPGDRYTTSSYAHAIAAACLAAGVDRWGPNRLRHSAATRIRRDYGLDAARAILGHQTSAITEVYAELDFGQAMEIASQTM